uniref:FH2 domain-containing protein n=1 Tax=Quercus lobata TaxID=97700 RepID=A0A7N2KPN3_QUELO
MSAYCTLTMKCTSTGAGPRPPLRPPTPPRPVDPPPWLPRPVACMLASLCTRAFSNATRLNSPTTSSILNEFLGHAEAEVRSLASLYTNVGRNANALAQYFGEDPARFPFEQVVSTLFNFVRMFVRAHEENCK